MSEKMILVSEKFVAEIAHEVSSLAEYFMDNYFLEHGKSPDVSTAEALLAQACEYLRSGGGA